MSVKLILVMLFDIEIKINNFCYCKVGRVIYFMGTGEQYNKARTRHSQNWKNCQFDSTPKIILVFECTHTIFTEFNGILSSIDCIPV